MQAARLETQIHCLRSVADCFRDSICSWKSLTPWAAQIWQVQVAACTCMQSIHFMPCTQVAASDLIKLAVAYHGYNKDCVKSYRHWSWYCILAYVYHGYAQSSPCWHGLEDSAWIRAQWRCFSLTSDGVQAALALASLGIDKAGNSISPQRLHDSVNVILSYQNPSGGWATYENTRSFHWVEVSRSDPLDIYWKLSLKAHMLLHLAPP